MPWAEGYGTASEAEVAAQAAELASERQKQLASWNVSLEDVAGFRAGTALRVLTPGSSAGEPVHILSSLERRPASWDADPEAGRAALSAAISLVLRLLGKMRIRRKVGSLCCCRCWRSGGRSRGSRRSWRR